jgi:transposase
MFVGMHRCDAVGSLLLMTRENLAGERELFAWLSQNRRMSKDYERLPGSSEAFLYVAMSRLMVRRLARA